MKSYINKLLTDEAREEYASTVERMRSLCPEMMARKIPEANVQQAFVYDLVKKTYVYNDTILCVGCYEDTAYISLVMDGYNVYGIDPLTDGKTLDNLYQLHYNKYHIIFSTSVIEHVEDDELFITEICRLLEPNGTAILTMDFRNDYHRGSPLLPGSARFYTKYDLEYRLGKIIGDNGCHFINQPDWEGEPDFWFQGYNYSLATLVFRKRVL
jgi:SAM-dependent methyltransferase